MTRKELVEKAFNRLANGNNDDRYLAIRDLEQAIQLPKIDVNDIKNTELTIYLLFAKILSNPPDKGKLDNDLRTILGAENKYHYQGSEDNYLHTIIRHNLAIMWLKSLKYDAFLEKIQLWRERVDQEKQDVLQLEQMFQSFDNNLLE